MTDIPHTTERSEPTESTDTAPETSPSCGWRGTVDAMHAAGDHPECDRPGCERQGDPIRVVDAEGRDDGVDVIEGVRCSEHAKSLLEASS